MIRYMYACIVVRIMRLKYLTLPKIVDVAYLCGIDNTPVFIFISGPTGCGKTWATQSISETNLVCYVGGVYSPNEHRKLLCKDASRTRLLINDDLGLAARWNVKEYIGTFIMVANGELEFTMHKQSQHGRFNCSVVLCCTDDHFDKTAGDMIGMGLLDRFVPIIITLSGRTKDDYRHSFVSRTEEGNKDQIDDRMPPQRTPELRTKNHAKTIPLITKKVDPRMLRNLSYMSQYLTDDEFSELIDVALNPKKFEL